MKRLLRLPDRRKLAVVMFLDMVNYSARMGSDERNALACVTDLEAILAAAVPKFEGRLVKFMGDGSMSCFPTAGQAVACALEILGQIRRRNLRFPLRDRFQVRIGLHLGDVVFEKGDLFGDAVNVAARVQPYSDPGGIAMTGIVYSQVRNKIPLSGVFLPPVKLKNIPEDIPIFSVAPPGVNLFFWKTRTNRRKLEWALFLTVGFLMASSLGSIPGRWNPARWALLGVLPPGDEAPQPVVRRVRQAAEMDFDGLGGFTWVQPEVVQGALRQRGIADPVLSVDRLDLAACHAAWREGLTYLVLLRIGNRAGNFWTLQCRVISPKKRMVVASFAAEGPDPSSLVGKLSRETEEWMRKKN